MNSYYFSVLKVNFHTAVSLFLIWLPSGVSWSLSFVTDHLSVQCTLANFLKTNRLLPKIFVKIGPTTCVLTILSDLKVRSQKFAMGGCFGGLGAELPASRGQWGSGDKAPSRRRHGGLGAEPPALENFGFFLQK